MMIAPVASQCTTHFIPAALASAISYLLDLNCPKCLFGGGGLRWDTQRALFCPGVGSEADFEAFFSIHAGQGEQGTWSCYLCGKVTLHSGNMRQHFEAYHFRLPIGLIQCRACAKTFKTRHSLATHMSKNHRDANKYWVDKSTPFDSPGQLIIETSGTWDNHVSFRVIPRLSGGVPANQNVEEWSDTDIRLHYLWKTMLGPFCCPLSSWVQALSQLQRIQLWTLFKIL